MDVVVVDVPTKFGMLLSRYWAAKLKGTMQMDMSYATIQEFGVQRSLYKENKLKYMISSKKCHENHPIYVFYIDMGSAIFCNQSLLEKEDHLTIFEHKQNIQEMNSEVGID